MKINLRDLFKKAPNSLKAALTVNRAGLIAVSLATLIFFLPLLPRLGTYSEGGDAMFNAWLIARNHHCILQQGCPDYTTANIYYPNQDTMLYSETELSAAVLTLPLHFIDKNPIFAYNVWTVLSFFFSGIFMYLLALFLSRRNQLFSVTAALIFEFAPIKMASVSHLQNLSIFYLPLIILLLLKYFSKPRMGYLIMLFLALVLQFYASWYQMVFVLIPVMILIVVLAFGKKNLGLAFRSFGVVMAAVAATIPLAIEYIQFAKVSAASFGIIDQVKYSASLTDYFIPYSGSALGRIYLAINPHAQRNAYNPDSFSYMGLGLLITAVVVVFLTFKHKILLRDIFHRKLVIALLVIMVTGFVISLGPLLKLNQDPLTFTDKDSGLKIVFALPYLAVDRFLPQLSFIRATGRAAILTLFALCCMLALFPVVSSTIKSGWFNRKRRLMNIGIVALIAFELLPLHVVETSSHAYNYNLKVPEVYQFIKKDPNINNIIILATDPDYPGATIPMQRAEWVLWSGYHNKSIFNGYSGYTPKNYFDEYGNFLDFHLDDVQRARQIGLRYVLVDKQLSSSDTRLIANTKLYLPHKVYEDGRYVLFNINE